VGGGVLKKQGRSKCGWAPREPWKEGSGDTVLPAKRGARPSKTEPSRRGPTGGNGGGLGGKEKKKPRGKPLKKKVRREIEVHAVGFQKAVLTIGKKEKLLQRRKKRGTRNGGGGARNVAQQQLS